MTTTPLSAAQTVLRDIRSRARQLVRTFDDLEEAEARGETPLSALAQAKLLVKLDRLSCKLEALTEQVADALADVPERRISHTN